MYKTEVKREATLAGDVPARPQFISAESRDFQLGLGVCVEDVKNEGFDFWHTGKQFFAGTEPEEAFCAYSFLSPGNHCETLSCEGKGILLMERGRRKQRRGGRDRN